jgi:PAS domain S-box-containing protein
LNTGNELVDKKDTTNKKNMARKETKKFLEEAKRIMDENVHLARFNETLRNVEKIKEKFFQLQEENQHLKDDNDYLKSLVSSLIQNTKSIREQVTFLEEILNSLHLIVSIKDLNRRNLLWYNQNYRRILGYRHKELQELNCEEASNHYHPEDYKKIVERDKQIADISRNRYSCVVRLKHINGNWLKMNSEYIVLKRNPDGSQSQALEILSGIEQLKS